MGELKVIASKSEIENKAIAEVLRSNADRVEHSNVGVIGFGVVFCFADGSIATFYGGLSYIHLLGGIGVLNKRVSGEFEND
jgi:hypothetical protein